jgi:hypothetical protein
VKLSLRPDRDLLLHAVALLPLAEALGLSVTGGSALPPRPAALCFAASAVAVGIALDPGRGKGIDSGSSRAFWWSAAVGLAAALLAWLNAPPAPVAWLALRLGLSAAVLALALAGATRLLELPLGGRSQATLCILALAALAGAAPIWLGPLAELAGRGLADAAVAASPLSYLAVAADCDYLRIHWFYTHSVMGSIRFDYPDPAILSAAYLALGLLFLAGAERLASTRR